MSNPNIPPDDDDETNLVIIDDLPGSPGFLTIGDISHQFNLTLRALRYYEKRHLLFPERRGPVRLYGRTDCTVLGFILKAKKLGFTLTEIESMVAKAGRDTVSAGDLPLTRDQCESRLRDLKERRNRLDWAIGELERMVAQLSSETDDRDGGAPSAPG